MKKIIVHTCVIAGSLLLAIGSAVAGPLSLNLGPVASKPPFATLVRQGTDDLVKHKRHGRGLDGGPDHVRHGSTSFSVSSSASSSHGRGSDDGASHEHHGGDDRGGDHHGGGASDDHGGGRGGDDHGGRR